MADFDKKAPEYDAWYQTQKGALVDALETECAFSLFQPTAGMRVLDAGCGTGNFSLKMAALGATVEGVDLSAPMIGYAKEKAQASSYADQLHFQVGDLYDLPFADESFDAVLSMAAFEFIHEDWRALEEFMRVVKPGGRVLIGTITGNSDWGLEYQRHMPREDMLPLRQQMKCARSCQTSSLRAQRAFFCHTLHPRMKRHVPSMRPVALRVLLAPLFVCCGKNRRCRKNESRGIPAFFMSENVK